MKHLWILGLITLCVMACDDSSSSNKEEGDSSAVKKSSTTLSQSSNSDDDVSSASGSSNLKYDLVGAWYREVDGEMYELILTLDSYECDFDKTKPGMDVSGDFTLSGYVITFKDTEGWAMDAVELGKYIVDYDPEEETLTFTLMSDGANGRPGIVVGTWEKP